MFELINKKTYLLLFIMAIVLTLVSTFSVVSKSVSVYLINDKLGHALMFFVLTFLCSHALGKKFGYKAIFSLVMFGLAIEVIQYFLSWRSFSIFDWFADIIGIVAYVVIHRLKRTYYLRQSINIQANLEEKPDV